MSDRVEFLSLDLPCDHRAPAAVRRALGEVAPLRRRLDDGLLVASELVTNAVLHSGCETGHRIQVRASALSDALLISVHDPGISRQDAAPHVSEESPMAPRWTPAAPDSDSRGEPTDPAEARPGGWGLRIVDQIARRWGTERPDGYLVWAELAIPS